MMQGTDMQQISDLTTLLGNLSPVLLDGTYVFCSVVGARYGDHAELAPMVTVQEGEGLTLVLKQEQADRAKLAYDGCFRCITLTVFSDLQAVGLTAAVAARLAERGISANVVAGYHHDHVMVPEKRAGEALELLSAFSTGPKSR
jgi:hypothetical protein